MFSLRTIVKLNWKTSAEECVYAGGNITIDTTQDVLISTKPNDGYSYSLYAENDVNLINCNKLNEASLN